MRLSCPVGPNLVRDIALCGDLPLLTWIQAHAAEQLNLDSDTMRCAVKSGGLDLVRWPRSLDPPCEWDSQSFCEAVAAKDLPMLAWMHASGCPCDAMATHEAVLGRSWDLLEWLHARDCPMEASCIAAAAGLQDLNTIKWLRAQRCPWDVTCTAAAAGSQCIKTMTWMLSGRSPCPWYETATYQAAWYNKVPMLEWILVNGCPLECRAVYAATSAGSIKSLWVLMRRGKVLQPDLFRHAVYRQRWTVVRWLGQQSVPPPHPAWRISCGLSRISTGNLMLLADMRIGTDEHVHERLLQSRKACCTFHGLLRWCRKAVSDPSQGTYRAFVCVTADSSGQTLLVRLAMLPQELIDRIVVMAGLQHDLIFGGKVDLTCVAAQ